MYHKLSDDERFKRMMAWEGDNLTIQAFIELFSNLVGIGMAWTLQGCYGKQAKALIDNGYIKTNGNITDKAKEEFWGTGQMFYEEEEEDF